jgi:hypothetical protein
MSRRLRFYDSVACTAAISLVACSLAVATAAGISDVSQFLSFSELMKLGRSLVNDRVPEQSRQSLPVPVRTGGDVRVAFMYAASQPLPNQTRLAPPHFISLIDPVAGTLVDLRPVTPQSFGQSHGPKEMIGTFSLPQGMDYHAYLAERERLFRLYERLVPAWAGSSPAERQDLRRLAQEFLRAFSVISEPPLAPYYDSLGADFFGWVRETAR